MCKYCDNLFSGNSSENLNHAEINANGVFMGGIVTCLEENEANQPVLSTVLMNNHGENIASNSIIIGWCPICGKSLKSRNHCE